MYVKTQGFVETIPPLFHHIQDMVNFALKVYFLYPSCIYQYRMCLLTFKPRTIFPLDYAHYLRALKNLKYVS